MKQVTTSINNAIRYKKQRKYTSDNSVVVKYLPRELAFIFATVILHVKPVEAEFCKSVYQTCHKQTMSFVYTINGLPVEPESMSTILSNTLNDFGLQIRLSDLRHALDAFAHKMGKATAWDPILATTANHSVGSSASYGRDQNSVAGIPANISEENAERYCMWYVRLLYYILVGLTLQTTVATGGTL